MPKGKELYRCREMPWEEDGLWLNPRLSSSWYERILAAEFPELPNHVWLTTSGTGGGFKIIALSRGALEASAAAVNAHLAATADDRWINPLPIFHVGGLGIVIRAMLAGASWERFDSWDAGTFVQRVAEGKATLASLVPTQVHDIVRAALLAPPSLRAVIVGGGALEETLHGRATQLGWPLLPSYGLTEAASQVATAPRDVAGSSWLTLLAHIEARVDAENVLSLRGASLLSGWMLFDEIGSAHWEDPKVAGWLRTKDRCELHGGMLRMLGRADDLIKIRGELVDVGALERALQAQVASGLVRVDVAPDARNGASLHIVAETISALSEAQNMTDVFPPYARPVSFRVGPVILSPLGKKIRAKI